MNELKSLNLMPYFSAKLGQTLTHYHKTTSRNYHLEVICTDEFDLVYFEVSSNSTKMVQEDYEYHGVVCIQLENVGSVLEVKKMVMNKVW